MAAYYPNKPSDTQRQDAKSFVGALSRLYPCTHCAAGMRDTLEESPVTTDSRESFSVWMCRMHNTVNEQLGKRTFPCTIDVLDERWRTGRPECWGGQGGDSSGGGGGNGLPQQDSNVETAEMSLGQDT